MSYLNREGDLRAKKEIPKAKLVFPSQESARKHLVGRILSPLLDDMGVVFEFTPSITVVTSASYQPIDMPHTNYDYHNYNKSSVQDITVDFELMANTKEEADRTLAIIHFFRTFTKMNFGINDRNRGLPPQLFRFSAYGDYMFNRVPVAIKNFSMPLTNDKDYVMTSLNTAVPSHCSFNIGLVFMPTPNKVRSEFSLDGFAKGDVVKKGYI